MIHTIHLDARYFQYILDGTASLQLRKEGKRFSLDDTIELIETYQLNSEHIRHGANPLSGRKGFFKVNAILQGENFGICNGDLVLSLERIKHA